MNKNNAIKTSIGALLAASSADAVVNVGQDTFVLDFLDEDFEVSPGVFESVNVRDNANNDWDIDGDGSNEVSFQALRFGKQFRSLQSSNATAGFGWAVNPGSASKLVDFSPGQVVDSGYAFVQGLRLSYRYVDTSTYYTSSNLLEGRRGSTIVGFRFNDAGGATHYGFATLSFRFEALRASLYLDDVRWEGDAGEGIEVFAVAVPEPAEFGAGLGLLAMGVAGLRRWRTGNK